MNHRSVLCLHSHASPQKPYGWHAPLFHFGRVSGCKWQWSRRMPVVVVDKSIRIGDMFARDPCPAKGNNGSSRMPDPSWSFQSAEPFIILFLVNHLVATRKSGIRWHLHFKSRECLLYFPYLAAAVQILFPQFIPVWGLLLRCILDSMRRKLMIWV